LILQITYHQVSLHPLNIDCSSNNQKILIF